MNVTAGGTLASLGNRRALLEGRVLNTLILNAKLRELLRYKMGKQVVKFAVIRRYMVFFFRRSQRVPLLPLPYRGNAEAGVSHGKCVWGCGCPMEGSEKK